MTQLDDESRKQKKEFMLLLGQRVRAQRERLHYTRETLAEYADVSVQFIADIETGRKCISSFKLKYLANALQMSSDSLIMDHPDNDDYPEIESIKKRLSTMTYEQRGKLISFFNLSADIISEVTEKKF